MFTVELRNGGGVEARRLRVIRIIPVIIVRGVVIFIVCVRRGSCRGKTKIQLVVAPEAIALKESRIAGEVRAVEEFVVMWRGGEFGGDHVVARSRVV